MLPSDICIQAEDGIRDRNVTGVHTCALPIFIREAGSLSNDVLSAVISGFIASSALRLIEDYVDEYRSEERSVGKQCRLRWTPDQFMEMSVTDDLYSLGNLPLLLQCIALLSVY